MRVRNIRQVSSLFTWCNSPQQPAGWWPPNSSEKTPGARFPFSTFPGAFYWSPRNPWSGSRWPRGRFSTGGVVSSGGAPSCSQTWCPPAESSCPPQWSARRRAGRWSRESTDQSKRSSWTLWSRWRSCWSSEVHLNSVLGPESEWIWSRTAALILRTLVLGSYLFPQLLLFVSFPSWHFVSWSVWKLSETF